MEDIYYKIGFYIVWVSFAITASYVAGFVFIETMNKISNFFKITSIIIEFAWKRKEFEEWAENYDSEMQEKRDLRKRISDLEAELENIYRQQTTIHK